MKELEEMLHRIKETCEKNRCCKGCPYDNGLCGVAIIVDRIEGKFPEEWDI